MDGEDTHMSITYLVHKTCDLLRYGKRGGDVDGQTWPRFFPSALVSRKTDAVYRDLNLELIQLQRQK